MITRLDEQCGRRRNSDRSQNMLVISHAPGPSATRNTWDRAVLPDLGTARPRAPERWFPRAHTVWNSNDLWDGDTESKPMVSKFSLERKRFIYDSHLPPTPLWFYDLGGGTERVVEIRGGFPRKGIMSAVLCSAPRAMRIVTWCGFLSVFLVAKPVCAWQAPPETISSSPSRNFNLRGNREKDLASRPAGEILQANRPALVDSIAPAAAPDRLTSSDIFLLKIVGAFLIASLVSLVGLKFLFSHGRKSRSPIVGPPPMGSGPPDPDGLRWLSGTVRSVTSREISRRRGGESRSDSQDNLAKPDSGSPTPRSKDR